MDNILSTNPDISLTVFLFLSATKNKQAIGKLATELYVTSEAPFIEIYAKFSLGRADILAAGDLAIQIAVQDLFDLSERPKEKELRKMAIAWSPWRSVAARLFWAYYASTKQKDGII
jgi:hypothetical protein